MSQKTYFVTGEVSCFDTWKKVSFAPLSQLLKWLNDKAAFCFDLETTGLSPHSDTILLASFGTSLERYVVDCSYYDVINFKKYLEDDKVLKLGTNIKFDYKMLLKKNIIMEKVYDVLLAEEVIVNGIYSKLHENPEQNKRLYGKLFSLAKLVEKYYDQKLNKQTRNSFINRDPKKVPFTEEEVLYAADDVSWPELIRDVQLSEIQKSNSNVTVKLENDVCLAVGDMEYNGVLLDTDKWLNLATETEKKLEECENELNNIVINKLKLTQFKGAQQHSLFEAADTEPKTTIVSTINWASPEDCVRVLNAAGIPVTDSKNRSLVAYMRDSELVFKLAEYRILNKAVTSYGKKFLQNIDKTTLRIHPNYRQLYPDTGRMSCEEPNLQNIKKESDYRTCFIAKKDHSLLKADFSNQELRLIADASQDPVWLEAFMKNEDLHGKLACLVFDIDKANVKDKALSIGTGNKTYRDIQKTIDFMLAYGGTEHKLSDTIGCSIEEASDIIKKFFKIAVKVKEYLDKSGEFAKKHGFIRTLPPINRIRYFPEFSTLHKLSPREKDMVLGEVERAGKNTPIQGSGADMMKIAMVLLRRWINSNKLRHVCKMILQVHDELVLEVKNDYTEQIKQVLEQKFMEAGKVIVKSIPMTADVDISEVWKK